MKRAGSSSDAQATGSMATLSAEALARKDSSAAGVSHGRAAGAMAAAG